MQQMGSPAMARSATGVKKNSMVRTLALLLGLASMGLAGFAISLMVTPGQAIPKIQLPGLGSTATKTQSSGGATNEVQWVAAAPGRVEPRSGQVRITAG